MNLSENICGIWGSKKYCPLISQILGEFFYDFFCGIWGSKIYRPLISQIIGEFFMNLSENFCGICGSKRYRPLISQIIGEFFLWIYLRISAGSAEANNITRWFRRLSESFIMNLSEKFCGICGIKRYRPLISQIIGEFYYEFICNFCGISGSKKYRPLISHIIGEFFMNLSENFCRICGSK